MTTTDNAIKSNITTPLKKNRIVACIPTYNEQETIGLVVKKMLQHVEKVYLVDDASTDLTVDRARAQGALVIKHDQRKGLGQTIHDLIEASIKDNPDIIVILEGDNLIYPEIFPDFLQPVLDHEAQVVFGLVREYSSTLGDETGESAEEVEGEGTENASTLAIRVLTLAAARRFIDLDISLLGELESEFDYTKKTWLIANVLIIDVDSEDSATIAKSELAQAPEVASIVEAQITPSLQIAPPPPITLPNKITPPPQITPSPSITSQPHTTTSSKLTPVPKSGMLAIVALALVTVLAGSFLVLNSGIVSKPDYTLVIQVPEGSGSMNYEVGSYSLVQGNTSRIEATPSLGWSFDYWVINNSTIDYTNPITIKLDGNLSLKAKFSQVKNVLTVACIGSGSTNPSVGACAYEINSTVQVAVTPMNGWQLDGWSLDGDIVTGGDSYSVVMNSDHMLVAILSPIQYTLDVEILGEGSVTRSPDLLTYPYGSDVLLITRPNQGWVLKTWSGAVSGSNEIISVTMNGNMSVTAEFIEFQNHTENYMLTIESPEGNGLTRPLNGVYSFMGGSSVEIEAIPAMGWQFDHWILDGQSVAFTNKISLTMSANHTIKPVFLDDWVTLSLNISGLGSGSITLSPSGGIYPHGTVVTLTAVPSANSSFTGWGGDLSGSANPKTITMDSKKLVTTNFDLRLCNVSLVQVGQGTATITPPGPCVYGSSINLNAIESVSGWVFSGWSSDPSIVIADPLDPSTTATVYGSGSLTSTFTPIMYTLSVSNLGAGIGSVVMSPAGGSYASGTVVTLEAVPGAGSSFMSWGGDLSGSINPTTLTMNSDKSVTAEFILF